MVLGIMKLANSKYGISVPFFVLIKMTESFTPSIFPFSFSIQCCTRLFHVRQSSTVDTGDGDSLLWLNSNSITYSLFVLRKLLSLSVLLSPDV